VQSAHQAPANDGHNDDAEGNEGSPKDGEEHGAHLSGISVETIGERRRRATIEESCRTEVWAIGTFRLRMIA
jgi:hypothetical protein